MCAHIHVVYASVSACFLVLVCCASVCTFMCILVHVCSYIHRVFCVCICCLHVTRSTTLSIHLSVYAYVYAFEYIFLYTHVYMYVCVHIMYVYMYVQLLMCAYDHVLKAHV